MNSSPVTERVRWYLCEHRKYVEIQSGSMFYYLTEAQLLTVSSVVKSAYCLQTLQACDYALNMTDNRIEVIKHRSGGYGLEIVAEALSV